MLWILLAAPVAISLAFYFNSRVPDRRRFPWLQFYIKGRESGFRFTEISALGKLAIESGLEDAVSLFWSTRKLDCLLKKQSSTLMNRSVPDEKSLDLLLKVFQLRNKIELELLISRYLPRSSLELKLRQALTFHLPRAEALQTMVLDNQPKYLAVARPTGSELAEDLSWQGESVELEFWHDIGAKYRIFTSVFRDYLDKGYPILHVAHSDRVACIQKRRSIRIKTNLPASVYRLGSIQEASESEESSKGLRCRLVDISEDGVCIMVAGRAKAGIAIKIRFELAGGIVSMSGLVKAVHRDRQNNRSLLHVQAVAVGKRTRIHILSFVFNLFSDRDQAAEGKLTQRAS